MESKKLLIGIFLIFITCTNRMVGQELELEGAFIYCDGNRMSFTFLAKNETSDFLAIGAYNAPPRGEPVRFGYFEFETETGQKFKLHSTHRVRCVWPNDTISLTGDLVEDDLDFTKSFTFVKQFKSKSEIRDCIINSRFSYTCIEEDFADIDACKIVFRSQEINTKGYFIIFISEGEADFIYLIE